jgi:hypothetical protein
MKTEGGGEWYQSIHFDQLSCRQVFFSGPKGTASQEKHKTEQSLIGVENTAKRVPYVLTKYYAHSVGALTIYL